MQACLESHLFTYHLKVTWITLLLTAGISEIHQNLPVPFLELWKWQSFIINLQSTARLFCQFCFFLDSWMLNCRGLLWSLIRIKVVDVLASHRSSVMFWEVSTHGVTYFILPGILIKKKKLKITMFAGNRISHSKARKWEIWDCTKNDFQVKYDSFLASLGDNLQQQVELL